jgi:DNA-binding NtrC family response regulator
MGQQNSIIVRAPSPQATRQPQLAGFADIGDRLFTRMPKLRELREDVFFRAEYVYLQNLVGLTGRNIRKACELSGLSRSRLYTLLKKYQISQSLNDRSPQK